MSGEGGGRAPVERPVADTRVGTLLRTCGQLRRLVPFAVNRAHGPARSIRCRARLRRRAPGRPGVHRRRRPDAGGRFRPGQHRVPATRRRYPAGRDRPSIAASLDRVRHHGRPLGPSVWLTRGAPPSHLPHPVPGLGGNATWVPAQGELVATNGTQSMGGSYVTTTVTRSSPHGPASLTVATAVTRATVASAPRGANPGPPPS
jgi:hypothetical protein